jgi:polyhydroxyalkanoate synthesis regulator phasin
MATEEDQTPQAERPSISGDSPVSENPTENVPTENVDVAVVQCANLFLNVRRLLFMSLGALALTAEEARDFVERLGERGDLAPGAAPELAQEELERWVDDLHHLTADGYPNRSASRVDALWGRLRVPTRREIETLSRKISALDQKLAALRATRASNAPPASPAGSATPSEL